MLKQFVFFALVAYLCASSAKEVAEENVYSKDQILSRAHSVGRIYTSRRNADKGKLKISQESAERLLEIANGPHNTPENVNQFADTIIDNVRRELLTGNGDPAVLPDTHIVFEFRPILITHTGTLDLTIGHLQELSTVRRQGDATLTAVGCESIITIPLSFRSIIARYNFLMEVRGDTAEGILHSWLENVTADYSVTIPCNGGPIAQSSFVKSIGTLQTNLFGTGLTSTYRDLITDLTTDLLITTVSEYSDAIVGQLLNNAVETILA